MANSAKILFSYDDDPLLQVAAEFLARSRVSFRWLAFNKSAL
jgi:hypothetical protein